MTEPEFYPLPAIARTAWRFAPEDEREAAVIRIIEHQAIEVLGLSPVEWFVDWSDNTIRRRAT